MFNVHGEIKTPLEENVNVFSLIEDEVVAHNHNGSQTETLSSPKLRV